MPRKSRDYFLTDFYHIMIQGDEKKYIFNKQEHKKKILDLITKNLVRNDVKIVAYCIMDNHVHILVYSKEVERISKMMLQCNTAYGKYYSKKRGCVGHVFRDRFKTEHIFTQRQLINCIKYIHENPVRAKMVKYCDDYLYSSFNAYLNDTIGEELKDICDFSDEEYLEIVKNPHTSENFMDEEVEKEKVKTVFSEIESKYDLDNLTAKEKIEIYDELNKRCKVTITQVASLLKMERRNLSKLLNRR